MRLALTDDLPLAPLVLAGDVSANLRTRFSVLDVRPADVKRDEAGPEARLVEALLLVRRDYQVRLVGQPPLVFVRVHERVTVPSTALTIENVLPVLAVAVSE